MERKTLLKSSSMTPMMLRPRFFSITTKLTQPVEIELMLLPRLLAKAKTGSGLALPLALALPLTVPCLVCGFATHKRKRRRGLRLRRRLGVGTGCGAELQLGPAIVQGIQRARDRDSERVSETARRVFINSIQYAVKIFQLQQQQALRQGSLRVIVVEQVATCGSASLAEVEGGKPRLTQCDSCVSGKGRRHQISYLSMQYLPIQSKHKSNRQELRSVFIAVVDTPKCERVCTCVCACVAYALNKFQYALGLLCILQIHWLRYWF